MQFSGGPNKNSPISSGTKPGANARRLIDVSAALPLTSGYPA